MTTKKTQQFPRLTGQNDKFLELDIWTICKNKQHRKLTEYYPKLVCFFQASTSSNCNENHHDFVQKHDRKSVPLKWWQAESDFNVDQSITPDCNMNKSVEGFETSQLLRIVGDQQHTIMAYYSFIIHCR